MNYSLPLQSTCLGNSISNLSPSFINKHHNYTCSSFDENYKLPKIDYKLKNNGEIKNQSLISKSTKLLHSFNKTPTIRSLIQKKQKKKKLYRQHLSDKPRFKLTKQQRYFQNNPVSITQDSIEKIGLYEASILFKAKNIIHNLTEFKIQAKNKLSCSNPKYSENKDLFMTNIGQLQFSVQDFIEQQLQKQKDRQILVRQADTIVQQRIQSKLNTNPNITNQKQNKLQANLYLKFINYQIVKDQSFHLLKVKHQENWGEVLLNISQTKKCLKKHKIYNFTVKQQILNFWQGKKILMKQYQRMLGLSSLIQVQQSFKRVIISFQQRLKVKRLKKKQIQKQLLCKWVVQRMKFHTKMNKLKKQRIIKARELQQKFKQNAEWDTQIHLSSFSYNKFQRNTTQFLSYFQNQYHSLWEDNDKNLILILPILNDHLLELIHSKIKIKRSVTIITPQINSLFPQNLSLAAQVFFSFQTLTKLKKAIAHKNAVLIPGMYQNLNYQLYLSQLLSVPLIASQTTCNFNSQRKIFQKIGIPLSVSQIIPSKSKQNELVQHFYKLTQQNPTIKKWIFKINDEFKGRGIASIQLNTSATITSEDSMKILKRKLMLRLKVNFENILYNTDSFISRFLEQGGIIEQQLPIQQEYQLMFNRINGCCFKKSIKVYTSNYVGKIIHFQQPNVQLMQIINKISQCIEQTDIFGYFSVGVFKSNNKIYLNDIKLGKNPFCSLGIFINMIDDKRMHEISTAREIANIPTKRPLQHKINTLQSLHLQHFHYIAVPGIVFSDIEAITRASLIEQLMRQTWNGKKIKFKDDFQIYLSFGLDLTLIVGGRDLLKLKKRVMQIIRILSDKIQKMKGHKGKQNRRDSYSFCQIIRAISKIKQN